MGFSTKSKRSAEALKERGGTRSQFFKVNPQGSELLIFPPIEKDSGETTEVLFTTLIHEYATGHGANYKIVKSSASPAKTGDKDELKDLGWEIKKKYKDSDSKKENEFWKCMVPEQKDHVVVLDLNDIDKGPQIFKMSSSIAKVVIEALKECGDDLENVCDFDNGRILLVETNGLKGKKIRYEAQFLDETANLISDEILTDDDLKSFEKKMPDMTRLQPKFDEQVYADYVDFIYDKAESMGVNLELDNEEEEVEEEREVRSERKSRTSRSKKEVKDEVEEDDFDESELEIEDDNNEVEDKKETKTRSRSSRDRKSSREARKPSNSKRTRTRR